MITTKKSLLAITLVSALGLGLAPTLYAHNDSDEEIESEIEKWDINNPPYALNEVTHVVENCKVVLNNNNVLGTAREEGGRPGR